MTQAMINPDIISWARQRADLDMSELDRKLNVTEERLYSWEKGEKKPTFKQAKNIAQYTYVPFGYLYLNKPPSEELPIPDRRTVGNNLPDNVSINLRDTIRDVTQRQVWFQEYQRGQNFLGVEFVGILAGVGNSKLIVNDMKSYLDIPAWPERGNWEDYNRNLVNRIESLGVLVMRSSMVGSNTH